MKPWFRCLARLFCWLWLLALAGGLNAAPVDPDFVQDSYEDDANTHKPRPYKRSAVTAVLIKENAARSLAGEDASEDCSRFKVGPAQIRQYFARARPVSQRAYSHELEWSPCVSNGSLKLADGRVALWGVQQYGLGWLYIDHRRYYFHCATCSLADLGVSAPPR